MPHDCSHQFEPLRSDVQTAAGKIGYRLLHLFCGWFGYPLETGIDNLKRFGRGDNTTINRRDKEHLTAFFNDTDLGRILSKKDALPMARTGDLLRVLRNGDSSANGHRLDGPYIGYHGSFMREGHFAKLAVTFITLPRGEILVLITYYDSQAIAPGMREAFGFAVFRGGRIEILMLNNDHDNADGFELITGVRFYPNAGLIHDIVGMLHGTNIHGQPFSRAVLIRRIPHPLSARQLESSTGVRPLEDWPKDDQAALRQLARCRIRPPFHDPISDL